MSGLRENVIAARQKLAEGRLRLKHRHDKGAPGIQTSGAVADLFDSIVLELFEAALTDLGVAGPDGLRSQVSLVPHAGYGRRDPAPYSDVDLMILHSPSAAEEVKPLAQRLVRDVFDSGLVLGQSVRTVSEACELAAQEAQICTSLVESRYLAGSVQLYTGFAQRFQHQARRQRRKLIAAMAEARAEERAQYGETVYLLEPNVKRSRGGLRDLQLLRWVGFVAYGTQDPEGLRLHGALSREDHDMLRRALEMLLRVRNELHFREGKAHDVLDRAEQVRLAELFGFRGTDGLLPVEQFMREYFRLTHGASALVSSFVTTAQGGRLWRKLLSPLVSHQFEGDFRIGPSEIEANSHGLPKLRGDLEQVLRLFDLANLYDKRIAHETLEVIRTSSSGISNVVTREAAGRFLSLLARPARVAELLHELHQVAVLEKVIPEFSHARSLLQFNEYHKYTIDEHSLLAVQRCTEFAAHRGILGDVYRPLKRKWLLHLALLIHDLGKGYPEDHSELGRRIAEDTARRLGLSEPDTETLKFLVHKHLMMSHLTFRRNTDDPQHIVDFAIEVGSPETLQMLFVLTAADLAAVGPDVLNDWKLDLLAQVYRAALQHLAGDTPLSHATPWMQKRTHEILALIGEPDRMAWYELQLLALPVSYLASASVPQVAADLKQLHAVAKGTVKAEGHYQPERQTLVFKVFSHENVTPGAFHKLTGALSSQGLQILSAEINTLPGGLIFDRFTVRDPDFSEEPPASRIDAVCSALTAALVEGKAPAFRKLWRSGERQSALALAPQPLQVRFDNNTSERYTIIDVFAPDRTGLLYTISRAIFELGLSVSVAKIGTYLDQVVDVFYVTEQNGDKVSNPDRLSAVRARLLADIAALETETSQTSGV